MAKKNSLVTQKNEMTEGRCDWTIHMSRAFCRVTDLFESRYNAWRAANPDAPNLFGWADYETVTKYDISRSDLAVMGKDGYEDMPKIQEFKSAFKRLAQVGITVGSIHDEENWMYINIIGGVKYDKETDTIHVEIVPMAVDYLVDLKKKFTKFNPWIAMKFQKSKYTFRFYEFCCQWRTKGNFELSLEELKHRFMLDEHQDEKGKTVAEKYKDIKDFKLKVLEPARQELQELYNSGDCDVCFSYDDICAKNPSGRGRPIVTGFHFTIKADSKPKDLPRPKPIEPSLFQDTNSRLLALRSTMIYYFSNSHDKKWPERAVNELGKRTVADAKLLDKAEEIVRNTINDAQKGKVRNVPATLRGAFEKILGINVTISKRNKRS